MLWFACGWTVGVHDHFAPGPAWLFDSLGKSMVLSVDDVRTPVEGLVRRLPSLCAWLPILELLCPTGSRRAVHPGSQGASGLLIAPAILHVPRLPGVVNWGVTEVLCVVTDQGPRILLDSLCTSGGVSQLVPTSSGYTWISRELHAVHDLLVPSLWGGLFLGPCAQAHGRGSHVHRDKAPHNWAHLPAGMERHVR